MAQNANLSGDCLAGLARFYLTSGLSAEGERLFEQTLRCLEADKADDPNTLQLRRHRLTELIEMLIRQSKLRQAIERAEAVIQLAGLHRDVADLVVLEGEVLRHLGNVVTDLGDRAQGDLYLEEALQVHRKLGNRTQEQAVLLYLGVTHLERYKYVVGRTYLQEALHLIQATGDRALEARIENALGFVLAALGKYKAALDHHHRSRQISRQIDDPFQESHALHNLCAVNRKLGRLETSEAYGREALRLGLEHHLLDPEAYAWLHLG